MANRELIHSPTLFSKQVKQKNTPFAGESGIPKEITFVRHISI